MSVNTYVDAGSIAATDEMLILVTNLGNRLMTGRTLSEHLTSSPNWRESAHTLGSPGSPSDLVYRLVLARYW